MFQRTIFLLVFLLAIYFPRSQQRHSGMPWLNLYHQAEQIYNRPDASAQSDAAALSLYKQVIDLLLAKPIADSFLFESCVKAGILCLSSGRNAEALQFFGQTVQIKIRRPSLPDTLMFRPYLYSGTIYYELSNLDSAFWFYKKAETLLTQYPAIPESQRLYNKLGALYFETGDYRKSIPYFTRALSALSVKNPPDPYFVVNYRNNIASALRKLGYADSAIAIYRELLAFHINEKELVHNIGVAFLDEGRYTEALFYLRKAAYDNQAGYNHLAQALLGLQQTAAAEKELNKAYKIYQRKGSPPHDYEYANSLRITGDLAMSKKNTAAALRFYQASLLQLKADFRDTAVSSNPVSFRNLGNSFALFDVLLAKARAFAGGPPDGARNAFQTYETALTLAKQLELRYHSDEARLFLNNKVTPAVQEMADLGITLMAGKADPAMTDKIFRWSEGNKAAVLQAGLYALQMDSLSGIPATLLQDDKKSKALLAKWYLQASLDPDTVRGKMTEKKITDLEIHLAGVQHALEEFPAYRQLELASRATGLDSIRQQLTGPDEAILAFYYTRQNLICFFITKEGSGIRYSPLAESLNQRIGQYRHELNAGIAADRPLMDSLSACLFNQLLKPVFEKIDGKKHLVIIPYNELSYIPFECLINPQNGKILLQDFALSYAYSANFLKKQQKPDSAPYSVLAFAPFTRQQGSGFLPALPASAKEVEHLSGLLLYDSQATKTRFVSLVAGYPVVHLATHAKANDTDPLQSYIEFYPAAGSSDTLHRLYESEIYHLDMKSARLVVLSACETGSGQLINGEGVMSLSRAFSYAGCPAVITSLWKAEDQSTAFISRALHQYLSDGKPVDEALQKAKLDFLESKAADMRHKSPAFWANLVLIGDYQPVRESRGGGIPRWIGVGLCVLVLGLLRYYKKTGAAAAPVSP